MVSCERLIYGDVASVLEPKTVCGESVRHNMTQLTGRGVVRVAEGQHQDDLPHWILTAMKCLAHWPNAADSTCNIPNYPGVERDVFKIVREFFTNMPHRLVEDLILNMSLSGQTTSTPHGEERGREGLDKEGSEGIHTPRLNPTRHPEASRLLLSLKLRQLRDYTDFKDDSLYPPERSISQELPLSAPHCLRIPTIASQHTGPHQVPPAAQDVSRPVSVQSGGQERPGSRGPETVRSIKTNDQARRLRREGGGGGGENVKMVAGEELDCLTLPDNCCFETAFTSDSPQTRIIPQKSVDSIHIRVGERQRPKSLAAPPLPPPPGPWDTTANASSASDLFRSSIMSLASRIRDSIKRKHVRDDSASRKRGGRAKGVAASHLRTESGGYVNPSLSGVSHDDTASTVSSEGLGSHGARLAHLRTKSGGFLNLALAPSGDSTDTLDSVPSAPLSARSDPGLLDHWPPAVPCPVPRPVSRPRTLTPSGCLSHSLHSSASGNSLYHSALSHPSREATPTSLSHTSRGATPTSLAPHTPLASPSLLRPVSGMAGIYSSALARVLRDTSTDLYKQLSSSANELSDGWADRTPHTRAALPFGRGGPWRHYHSSPSKRRVGRRRGAQVFWGSKACLPGLLTREGREAAISSARLLLLLLPPVRRRKLHLLLRMMSKMTANEELSLGPDLTTRALVLNTFARSILLCHLEADHDEVLALRVVAFLMDAHTEVMCPPQDLAVLAHRRLNTRHRSMVVYAAAAGERSVTNTYCRQVSPSEYQRQRLTGSQLFLTQLLDQLINNTGKFSAKERKKKLKEFKSLYPEVYRAKFPEEEEPHKPEGKSRMRSLIKLASLTSLTSRGRQEEKEEEEEEKMMKKRMQKKEEEEKMMKKRMKKKMRRRKRRRRK
ncbi:DEP domain-containing protein 1B [Chionoecetes opilio]|uniref:DEP domain-containing protein 1B n=1 Tax=Chionoecetes opilio TaxID=41210 RepID=A0A8J4XXC9_CHIOP|nr:DEP domain-containing protein 1B [Chionoecetes opilio]